MGPPSGRSLPGEGSSSNRDLPSTISDLPSSIYHLRSTIFDLPSPGEEIFRGVLEAVPEGFLRSRQKILETPSTRTRTSSCGLVGFEGDGRSEMGDGIDRD